MNKPDWKFIVDKLKAGDNSVLAVFYEEHTSYCCSRLVRENKCSIEDAEDIFIESVMSLRERIIGKKYDTILNVRHYLYGTCYNMFLSRLRQHSKAKRYASDIERFYYESSYQDAEDEPFDPKLMKITIQAWEFLTDRCRDILHFFYIDKLSMKEIAGLMDLSNTDVAKTTKSRCYKKLTEKAFELHNKQKILEQE